MALACAHGSSHLDEAGRRTRFARVAPYYDAPARRVTPHSRDSRPQAALPRSALADDNDDAMAKIAAKAMEKNEAVKQKAKAKVAKDMAAGKVEKENAGSNVLIAAVGAGSVLFSLPFFCALAARALGTDCTRGAARARVAAAALNRSEPEGLTFRCYPVRLGAHPTLAPCRLPYAAHAQTRASRALR